MASSLTLDREAVTAQPRHGLGRYDLERLQHLVERLKPVAVAGLTDQHDTRRAAVEPLVVTETRNNYDVWVNVKGGGITGQSESAST